MFDHCMNLVFNMQNKMMYSVSNTVSYSKYKKYPYILLLYYYMYVLKLRPLSMMS